MTTSAKLLQRAAEILEREARVLFDNHTTQGVWHPGCTVRAEHDEMLVHARALRGLLPFPKAPAVQWFRDGHPIPGATSPDYALTEEDAGKTVTPLYMPAGCHVMSTICGGCGADSITVVSQGAGARDG